MTLLVVYRGMWCSHCKHQLQELEALHREFSARRVDVLAVSADTQERATKMAADYGIEHTRIGYEMPLESAREFGLFISSRVKDIEMPLFSEPGSFLIDSRSRLFAAWIASNAFARTAPQAILDYIDFIANHSDRAPRGSA